MPLHTIVVSTDLYLSRLDRRGKPASWFAQGQALGRVSGFVQFRSEADSQVTICGVGNDSVVLTIYKRSV